MSAFSYLAVFWASLNALLLLTGILAAYRFDVRQDHRARFSAHAYLPPVAAVGPERPPASSSLRARR